MKDNNQLPPLPTPKFTETIRGVPCITVTEHEHLMRAYALQARAQVQGEPIGEVGTMPGTSGFTMACFRADEAPVGTKLYTAPQPAQATQAEVTDEQIVAAYIAWCRTNGTLESFARALLALRPELVPMTHKQAIEMNDAAFDKYMTQDARAIELVRSVEAHHRIQAKKEQE